METLEKRIAELEQCYRRMKMICLGILVFCGGMMIMGQAGMGQAIISKPNLKFLQESFNQTKTISVQQLQIVDQEGKTRGIIGTMKNGVPGIFLFAPDGDLAVKISSDVAPHWSSKDQGIPEIQLLGDSGTISLISGNDPQLSMSYWGGRESYIRLGMEKKRPIIIVRDSTATTSIFPK